MKALKFAERRYKKYLANDFEGEKQPKNRFRESGAGRKCKALEVREAIFEWFINVRGFLRDVFQRKYFEQSASKFTQNG